jgi:hypothetical protein
MQDQIRKSLIILFLACPLFGYSQKAVSVTKEDVIREAKEQLTRMSSEDGELRKFCSENNVKGEFVIDLTLQGKGKVLTIFMVSSSVDELKYQNLLKSKLTEIQFRNIKIPKKERVKFRQTLTF